MWQTSRRVVAHKLITRRGMERDGGFGLATFPQDGFL